MIRTKLLWVLPWFVAPIAAAMDGVAVERCLAAASARVAQTRDLYHGVAVVDPYRWLENAGDPEVRAWSAAQSACSREHLDALPAAPKIRARLTELLTTGRGVRYASFRFSGGTLFALRSAPSVQQPALVRFEGPQWSAARVVFDPLRLDPSGGTTIDWYVPSPDASRVAVSLSAGGSERGALHLFDASTGRPIESRPIDNVNNATAGGDLVWSADNEGFYYTRYPRATQQPEQELAFHQQVYYHRLGTPSDADRYELGAGLPRTAAIRLRSQDHSGRILAWVQNGDSGQFRFFLRNPAGEWRPFGSFTDGHIEAAFAEGDDIFLLTTQNAPRGRVLRVSARTLDLINAQTIVAESERVLSHSFYWSDAPTLMVHNRALLLRYQAGGPTQLQVFSLRGEPLPSPQLPAISHVAALTPLAGSQVMLGVESFVEPRKWHRYDVRTQQDTTAFADAASGGWSDVTVTREFAVSRDGTRVPVTILRQRGRETRGLLLTGYGGYRIALTPQFESNVRLLLEQGVAYAIANLRGGSEFGEEWHRQGSLLQKQNVFDDFISVAEHLSSHHYVPPGKLAISGASNGGLLMGAVVTQRPTLAQAVIAKVGVFDSLRNELDTNGVFNIPEFGTVANAEQFRALYAYSPYHNVKQDTRYPAMLFLTGANDSRVNPMHSRKMVARLQAASTSGAPILLRTSSDTGHGSGTPLAARVEEFADEYAFILKALAIEYRESRAEREAVDAGAEGGQKR